MKIKNNSRLTVGFLFDWSSNPYHLTLLKGVHDFTIENDINLICFEGGNMDSPYIYDRLLNKTYDFANADILDGVIILGSTISSYCGHEKIVNFCNKYKPLPIINIGFEIEGIPSILIDNKSGMKKLIEHLIHHHNFKKFAFIKGTEDNFDTKERYETFLSTLKLNNIEINKKMILQGNFQPDSGIKAVSYLLDECKDKFDAIIASNDHMAMGAIGELKKRGIEVPFDVSVTGFDNLDISQYSIPPLTTVAQPIYDQGKISVELLLNLINKKDIPQKTILPTELIIRDSCSYFCSKTINIKTNKLFNTSKIKLNEKKEIIKKIFEYLTITSSINTNNSLVYSTITKIIDVFLLSIENNDKNIFFKFINNILSDEALNDIKAIELHNVITALRNIILPMLSDKQKHSTGENICYDSIILFIHKVAQNSIFIHDELFSFQWALNLIQQELCLSFDRSNQIKVLANRLPELGIKSCFLYLFTGNKKLPENEADLVLAYDENGDKDISKMKKIILTDKLIPDSFFSKKRKNSYIVEFLIGLGIIIIEMLPVNKSRIYKILRDHIRIAFSSANLFHELNKQKNYININFKNLRRAMEGYLETMGLILESRDPYTAGHQRRVSDLARSIAIEMNLSQEQIECVRMAGLVHDLGKISIPAEILNKPGSLADIEFSLIKQHSTAAYNVLKNIDFPWPIAEVVYQHHERINGSGYPQNLIDKQIMIEAKILSVADVVEAMASYRPYRPSLGIEAALDEIDKNKGILYDNNAVNACIRVFKINKYMFKK